MPETMQNALNQLRDWWTNAPRATRLGIIGGAVGLLVLFVALGFWAATPSYTTLYTGLSPADSAAVVQTLKEKGIRVRTSGSGSVVEVESGRAEEARLELAAKGLPKTGAPGYARLEKTPFGITQAMEQTTLRIALEEELQNTIQHLEPVESARVHITPGNDSPFADSRTEPTASVVVNLKPNATLTREQIRGIVHLVCHSVEGLKPERVTIVDGEARPLWNGGDASEVDSELVRARREAERAYADELRRQLQQQLDRVLGAGKSSVVVQAELDLDREEVQAQRVEPLDPNRAAVVSETSSTERLSGNMPTAGGPAGIAANRADTPMYPTTPPVSPSGEYNREDRVRNYEINKQVEHIIRAPGRIERLSVAVLVDQSIPQETLTAIRNWLETTVGASPDNPSRTVTVQAVKFDTSQAEAAQRAEQARERAQRLALLWQLLPFLVLLIVFFFLARVIGKQLKRPQMQPPRPIAALPSAGGFDMAVGEQGLIRTPSEGTESSLPTLQGGQAEATLPESAPAIQERMQPELVEIRRFAEHKPEHVAALLKNWLKD
ncbi:MAG: flagellar basal-body MS-ring/collar protein FliF [Armatimonadota bacterium]